MTSRVATPAWLSSADPAFDLLVDELIARQQAGEAPDWSPLAATMDPRQLERFRHEARAAALLHHPHVVPVHGVGCERGVHYYAMQLIEGCSLAAVIDVLRGADPGGNESGDGPTGPHAPGGDSA